MRRPAGGSAVKWIIGAAFAGWVGILRMVWLLAENRIDACHYENGCIVRVMGQRDSTITASVTLALILAIIVALTFATELSLPNWRKAPKWRHKKWGDTQSIHLPDQRDVP